MKELINYSSKWALAGIAYVLVSSNSSSAALRHVPADYPTIQAAVDAAGSGDIIRIGPGVYTEQVVITNKSLTLSGSPGAILRATPGMQKTLEAIGSGSVPLVGIALTTDVVISGLTLEGERLGDSQSGSFRGIYFLAASGAVLDCRIVGFRDSVLGANDGYGVLGINPIRQRPDAVSIQVLRSTFADNLISINMVGDVPVLHGGPFDPTAHRITFALNDNTIVGNGPSPDGAQYGIWIDVGAGGEVKRNTITDHSFTGTISPATGSPFAFGIIGNDAENYGSGRRLAALQPVVYEGNIFRDNQWHLMLLNGAGSSILNNSFEGTAAGDRPTGLAVSGEGVLAATNRFKDMPLGILLIGDDIYNPPPDHRLGVASNTFLTGNRFCNVSTNLAVETSATYTEQGTLMTCLPPSLSIRAIQLSWPYWFNGYSVETAPSANGPWTQSEAAPFPQDGRNNLLMPMNSDQQFYRLSRP